MIGKAYKLGTGFKALAAYLQYGRRDGTERDRVDWVESRNLPTEHPQAAARIMIATARDSDSVQPPVYHFTVSFDPKDPVTRDTMRQVVDRTLRDLGLQEHQVLVVAHCDRAHAHLHFMVNRIHPGRGTVWSNWNDYARIERTMREQEAELGLRIVPGKHAPVPEQARHRAPRTPAPRLVRGDDAFAERVRREAGPHLMAARSWAELEHVLGERGLSVRVEGPGMVVTDGVHKVKCSEIDRAAARANLERRLGSLGEYHARKAVDGRTLDERTARVQPAPDDPHPAAPTVAPPEPAPAAGRQSAAPQAEQDARVEQREPDPLPRPAPSRAEPPARTPPAPIPPAPEPIRVEPPRPPRAQPVAPAPPPAAAPPSPSAPELPDWLRDLALTGAAIEAAEQRVDEAGTAVHDAEHALAMMPDRATRAEAARDSAAARLREVYADPKAALEAITAFRRLYGDRSLLSAISAKPEQFGALRWTRRPDPRTFGIIYKKDTTNAERDAPLLALALEHYYAASASAPTSDERTAAPQRVTDAKRAQDAALEARRALPPGHSSRYRRELAEVFRSEGPGRAALLAHRITMNIPSAARFVADTLKAVDAEERRRERERGRGLGIDF